jgi:hypothetical protein
VADLLVNPESRRVGALHNRGRKSQRTQQSSNEFAKIEGRKRDDQIAIEDRFRKAFEGWSYEDELDLGNPPKTD